MKNRLRLAALACLMLCVGRARAEDPWKAFLAAPADGPIPDFSYAGYHQGEVPLPDLSKRAAISVADFGAKGDGQADDTDAFARAIRVAAGRVVSIPAGRFVLTDRLIVTRPNTVLRGAGVGKTVLLFRKGLNELDPYPLKNGNGSETSGWSWDGGLISFDGRDANPQSFLCVSRDVPRGSTELPLDMVRNMVVGQLIELRVDNPRDSSLAKYIYAGSPGDVHDAGSNMLLRQVVGVAAVGVHSVTIDRPTRFDLREAWNGRVVLAEPRVTESGVEGLTIEMPNLPYLGHFKERGFNGINFVQTRDCWVRDVEIVNCDDGVLINGDRTTVMGLTLRSERERSGDLDGHHAIYIRGTDNLLRNVDWEVKFVHDITVERGASGNVLTASKGKDLCLDHHRWGPFSNLWCDLDMGLGTRPWTSGGAGGRGKHAGTREVFWNLRSSKPLSPPDGDYCAPECVFVGVAGLEKAFNGDGVVPGAATPANLYDAQLQRRLATTRP